MTNPERLPAPFGLYLNRDAPLQFTFDGRPYSGYAGDSIASALAANNQWLLSRSFKYHRPRGALTMAGQDANTLVQLPGNPNVLADRHALADGLCVTSQNTRGSLANDRAAVTGAFSRFLPVGFYYKAFYRPQGIWNFWSRIIRKRAGLGVIDTQAPRADSIREHRFCDVLVVGAGPAGLAAAIAAGKTGGRVIVVDENPLPGGSLNYARAAVDSDDGSARRDALLAQLAPLDNVDLLLNATANGWYADNWVPVIQGHCTFKIRAAQVVLCTGAMEQQALFHNNDLPGIMMAGAAQRLMRLYGVRPGRAAVVLTGNTQGYGAALDLFDAGVNVRAVVDLRNEPDEDDWTAAVATRGITVLPGHAVYAAKRRGNHLAAVDVRRITGRGQCASRGETLACDLLCMAVGTTPAYQLACQAGARLSYDDTTAQFSLEDLPPGLSVAGDASGVLDPEAASPNFDWPIFPHPKRKEFVDFDEDLQVADILNAVADGYEHVQLVKRYSTCGMGPSQGRHSALATARLVADVTGRTVAQTGVTTARPPFAPETLGQCAARKRYPARRSPMHYRHLAAGACMMQAGAWYRPAFYGEADQRKACIAAEASHVRNAVGLIDVSTLGGIDVVGGDAAEFLGRIYTGNFSRQPVARARYALATNEAGVVIDDGVACRMHEHAFYVTATTSGVERLYRAMLKWNTQWRLDVTLANVTSAWCAVNLAGPGARAVLQAVCHDVALSADAFPYMGVQQGTVAGIPARLIRTGFVGELGFEIHVPALCGEALWDALLSAGHDADIRPFGVEAQRLLRLEKGHIIIGQDTDANTVPAELDMGWAVARNKPFFVGQRSLHDIGTKAPLRKLAGFVIDNGDAPLPDESHLVLHREKMVGHVTSFGLSTTLGKPVGLAFMPPALAQVDNRVEIRTSQNTRVNARVVTLPFYDPDNARQALT